jgi:hypothetical protein
MMTKSKFRLSILAMIASVFFLSCTQDQNLEQEEVQFTETDMHFDSQMMGEGEGGKVVPGNWPPHPEVSFTRVGPFPFQEPQKVPTGDWIQHVFGWLPEPIDDNSKERVEEFIEKSELEVWIGGELVEDPKQYYVPFPRPSDGLWIAVWAYSVPPKSPGTYAFKFRITDAVGAPSESEADYSVKKGKKNK